jgi:tRNA threonylcarbamoyladenosine biosynthesis protein TsaE
MQSRAAPTNQTYPLATRRDTLRLARHIARSLAPGDLIILTGELGAGKTFLVRGICRALGLPERIRVTSPTFNLVHEIGTQPPILHVDLYRLDSARQVADLDLRARRDDGCALLVEWGEPFAAQLGGDALLVGITAAPRVAHLTSQGDRSAAMLAQISQSRNDGLHVR